MDFYKGLKTWYIENKRILPWRGKNDPYVVWLSEIILQQTKVDQGITYYYKILKKYPNVAKLAQAKEDELLVLWQGLGYYSRALNLLKTSRIIHNDFEGIFPKSAKELEQLPGIGSYTAAAIASFCYKEVVPVLDGNVYRLITRLYGITEPIHSGACKKICTERLYETIPSNEPDIYNQAIMEFGALHCTPKNPNCADCPFQLECVAKLTNKIELLPIKKKAKKKKIEYRYYFHLLVGGELAVLKRNDSGIWKNLYELPVVLSEKELVVKDLKASFQEKYGSTINVLAKPIFTTQHLLSHIKMHAYFYDVNSMNKEAFTNVQWIQNKDREAYAFHQLIHKYFNSL